MNIIMEVRQCNAISHLNACDDILTASCKPRRSGVYIKLAWDNSDPVVVSWMRIPSDRLILGNSCASTALASPVREEPCQAKRNPGKRSVIYR